MRSQTMQEAAANILDKRLIGKSPAILNLRKSIVRVAPSNLPILISGEAGVGKDLVVSLLHDLSARADKPFVRLNMGAVNEALLTSELFGHVKGAFTGATRDRLGLFALANGGTLYLNELEQSSPGLQRLLTSFLATQSFVPLGDTQRKHVDVRIIASVSTNPRDIDPDLLFRLSGFVLRVPPLRERVEDIPLLIRHFLKAHSSMKKPAPHISDDSIARLQQHNFPGNVRELSNTIERAVVMSDGGTISVHDLALPEPQQESERDLIERLRRQLAHTNHDLELLRQTTIPADPIWQGRGVPVESDYCFVLMPFADTHDLQDVYENYVKRIAEERCGLRCERADDIHDVSGIMQSVWESINRARFVIADLTDRNPNVFYELGIAHTLGKPVIMLAQSMDHVPFDLRHLRCIVYDFKPGRIEKFEKMLEKTIRTVMAASPPGPSFDLVQE